MSVRLSTIAAALFSIALMAQAPAASAAAFVDAALSDVKPEDRVTATHPMPVQVLFQFQTKGAPNGAGTKILKDKVIAAVKDSGLFSEVTEAPTANGALLSIVINDAYSSADISSAEGQGFVTGATFFVAGSTIREPYTAKLDYMASATAPIITRTAMHAVYTQLGLINSAPDRAVKVEGGTREAVFTMVRQIVANPLNAIARDPAFQGAAPSEPATPAAPGPEPAAPPAADPATPPTSASTASDPQAHP